MHRSSPRQARADLADQAGGAAISVTFTVVTWALTGGGPFWPMWVIAAFVIALVLSAHRAFFPQS